MTSRRVQLRPHAAGVFARAYADAREQASVETGLPLRTFPNPAPTPWTRPSIPSSCRSETGGEGAHGKITVKHIGLR